MKKTQQYIKTILLSLLVAIALIIQPSPSQAGDLDCFTKPSRNNCETKSLNESEKCKPTYDYTIRVIEGKQRLPESTTEVENRGTVLSIHGGIIEPYTSELAAKIADRLEWDHYDFAGHATTICMGGECPEDRDKIRKANFKNLHITSTGFNEPIAEELVKKNPKTISVHAYNPDRTDDETKICVGGRNKEAALANNPSDELKIEPNRFAKVFIEYINSNSDDLEAINALDDSNDPPTIIVRDESDQNQNIDPCGPMIIKPSTELFRLKGANRNNITNVNENKEGLQLEFNLGLLEGLATNPEDYQEYEKVILDAIEAVKEL